MTLTGGCHCGAVRYTADGEPFHETICYCVDCRRSSGAVSVAWFSLRRRELSWTGTPAGYRSSPTVTRRFCTVCGTTLTFEDDRFPDELDVATATLDEPTAVPPRDHVFVSQRPAWEVIGGTLPQYQRSRREG